LRSGGQGIKQPAPSNSGGVFPDSDIDYFWRRNVIMNATPFIACMIILNNQVAKRWGSVMVINACAAGGAITGGNGKSIQNGSCSQPVIIVPDDRTLVFTIQNGTFRYAMIG